MTIGNQALGREDSGSEGSGVAPDNWGSSWRMLARGVVFWIFVLGIAFWVGIMVTAFANDGVPDLYSVLSQIVGAVNASGEFVGWVAPALLASLIGLSFLMGFDPDSNRHSLVAMFPGLAVMIGSFLLVWMFVSLLASAFHPDEVNVELLGLVILAPVSAVFAASIGRLNFVPLATRMLRLKNDINRAESDIRLLSEEFGLDTDLKSVNSGPSLLKVWGRAVFFSIAGPAASVLLLASVGLPWPVVPALGATFAVLWGLVCASIGFMHLLWARRRMARRQGRPRWVAFYGISFWALAAGATTIAVPYPVAICGIGLDWTMALVLNLVFFASVLLSHPLRPARSLWPRYMRAQWSKTLDKMHAELEQLELRQLTMEEAQAKQQDDRSLIRLEIRLPRRRSR